MERATLSSLPLAHEASTPVEAANLRRLGRGRGAYARLSNRWDWRLSAHCRLASAASLWAIVFASPFIGFVVGPLLLIRFLASAAQMVLNHGLQGRQPIMRPPMGDWMLLVLAVAGASVAAAIEPGNSVPTNPLLISLALIPFSAVQVRIAMRAYTTAANRSEPLPMRSRQSDDAAAAA